MQVLDYGASFLAGTAAFNAVRFWVESRLRIIDEASGAFADYYQCASCKSEDTFAERDLFLADNYDFLPVFGPEWGAIFRRPAHLSERYRSVLPSCEMWGGQRFHLRERPDARELATNAEMIEATVAWEPLVARTEIRDHAAGRRAIIEYLVKTMNVKPDTGNYQVDTGPLVFPDLSLPLDRQPHGFTLAFAAFNAPHFTDFVLEVPTAVTNGQGQSCETYHYSRRVSLPAKNTLYALPIED
ncbi:MAG: hypothetical protein ACYDCO_22505 [Armatimonadota bacterium]